MSKTLFELQAMLGKQFGIAVTDLNPESSLMELGPDAVGLEELRWSIEETYKISVSEMVDEHYGIDMLGRNLLDQTLRQLAGWVDQIR